MAETEEQQRMLERYEMGVYRVAGVRIMVGGERVSGRTFVWAGDLEELVEGTWEVGEWRRGVQEEMASHFRAVEEEEGGV